MQRHCWRIEPIISGASEGTMQRLRFDAGEANGQRSNQNAWPAHGANRVAPPYHKGRAMTLLRRYFALGSRGGGFSNYTDRTGTGPAGSHDRTVRDGRSDQTADAASLRVLKSMGNRGRFRGDTASSQIIGQCGQA
jgi:hypothetical protein